MSGLLPNMKKARLSSELDFYTFVMKISRLFIMLLLLSCVWGAAQSVAIDDTCGSIEGTAERIQCVNDKAFTEAKIKNYPEGRLKETCETRWGAVREELLSCLETQTQAWLEIKDAPETMKVRCQAQWSTDYELTKHCIDRAIESEALKVELQELTPPLPAGSPTVLRYVEGLEGPFTVNSVTPEGDLEVTDGESTLTIKFAGIKVWTKSAPDFLSRRLSDNPIWLEKAGLQGYIFAKAKRGDWSGQNLRLTQINLVLVELGLAVPTTNRGPYAHFYANAASRAEYDRKGVWSSSR